MNVFPTSHIEHLRSKRDVFWHNGPPPEVLESEQVPENAGWFYGRKAVAFLASLERTHSIRASKQAVDMDNFTYSTLVERSAWFCESINRLAAEMTHEIRMTAHTKAVGYTEIDEATGLPVTDASGKVVHRGGSVPLTLALMGDSSLESGFLRPEAEDPDLGPLLPSNVDAHRQQQLNVLHRAMLALQPQVDVGDRQAIDTLIKLQDQVSKLSGTHAPKTTVSYVGGPGIHRLTDEQLEQIAAGGLTLVPDANGVYSPEDEA